MQYNSNGKLLLTGEYLVLDGAEALAIPTQYGQSLKIEENTTGEMIWESYNVKDELWFSVVLSLQLEILKTSSPKIADTLVKILLTAQKLNKDFLAFTKGGSIKTYLTFPNEWGLGTSSTLINNIASWAEINAFELLEKSFGGSGYDIACAQNDTAIVFRRNGFTPKIEIVDFNPSFKDQLFFVYLNQKQDSKEGVQLYRALTKDKSNEINKIKVLTKEILEVDHIQDFNRLLEEHEAIISELLALPTVKEKFFNDYTGAIKSLGAWGGDFVLVTGNGNEVRSYFEPKGYQTILAYTDMVK